MSDLIQLDPALIRALSLFGPVTIVFVLWLYRNPDTRRKTAILLAILWCIPTLVLSNTIAIELGWWHFEAKGALFRGQPVESLIGWAVLWGALPLLAFERATWVAPVVLLLYVDVLLMPRGAPVVVLGPNWLYGEALVVVAALIPSLFFARWTAQNRRLGARVVFQALTFGSLSVWLVPEIVFAHLGGSFGVLGSLDATRLAALQIGMLFGALGLSAVVELYQRGRGTPLPFDPPTNLVISGLYRYVANPMQLSMTLLLILWGFVLSSPGVLLFAAIAFIYSIGLAAWDEGEDMRGRFGNTYTAFRSEVRPWRPRLRPYVATPAKLYFGQGCSICEPVAAWFRKRNPVGLELVPAQHYPGEALRRMTYVDGEYEASGLEAVARGLEHLQLAWAIVGAYFRLPVVQFILQTIVDASGGGPRDLTRSGDAGRPAAPPTAPRSAIPDSGSPSPAPSAPASTPSDFGTDS